MKLLWLLRSGALALCMLCVSGLAMAQEPSPLFTILPAEGSMLAASDWMAMSAEFNDRLLATVYWALGTVVGLVALVVGVNWFTGQRAYDRDRSALETVLKSELASGLSTMREEILRASTELRGEQTKSQMQLREELTAATAARGIELGQRLDEIVANAAAPIDLKINALERSFKDSVKGVSDNLTSGLKYQSHRLSLLEALSWMPARDVPTNAVRYYAEALDSSFQYLGGLSDTFLLQQIADLVPRCGSLSGSDVAAITSALNKAPSEHSVAVAKIRDLLSKH